MTTIPAPPPSEPRSGTAVASGLAAVLGWASALICIRYELRFMGPVPLVLLRFAAGAACFALLALVGRVRLPRGRDVPALFLLGAVGQAAYQFALAAAETRITAGTASLLLAMIPVFTALLSGAVLSERLSARGWLGMAVAVTGTFLVGMGDAEGLGVEPMALLALVAAACSAAFFVFQKPWLDRYTALEIAAYGVWSGLAIALFDVPETVRVAMTVPARALLGAAYLGVVPTAASYALWTFALSRGSAGKVSALAYCQPVFALALGWMLLGEVPAPVTVLGGSVAMAGALLASSARSRRPTRRRGP